MSSLALLCSEVDASVRTSSGMTKKTFTATRSAAARGLGCSGLAAPTPSDPDHPAVCVSTISPLSSIANRGVGRSGIGTP